MEFVIITIICIFCYFIISEIEKLNNKISNFEKNVIIYFNKLEKAIKYNKQVKEINLTKLEPIVEEKKNNFKYFLKRKKNQK